MVRHGLGARETKGYGAGGFQDPAGKHPQGGFVRTASRTASNSCMPTGTAHEWGTAPGPFFEQCVGVLGVPHKVLGVLHRVLGIPHRVLRVLHRVPGGHGSKSA